MMLRDLWTLWAVYEKMVCLAVIQVRIWKTGHLKIYELLFPTSRRLILESVLRRDRMDLKMVVRKHPRVELSWKIQMRRTSGISRKSELGIEESPTHFMMNSSAGAAQVWIPSHLNLCLMRARAKRNERHYLQWLLKQRRRQLYIHY